jgi:hypothetical protein
MTDVSAIGRVRRIFHVWRPARVVFRNPDPLAVLVIGPELAIQTQLHDLEFAMNKYVDQKKAILQPIRYLPRIPALRRLVGVQLSPASVPDLPPTLVKLSALDLSEPSRPLTVSDKTLLAHLSGLALSTLAIQLQRRCGRELPHLPGLTSLTLALPRYDPDGRFYADSTACLLRSTPNLIDLEISCDSTPVDFDPACLPRLQSLKLTAARRLKCTSLWGLPQLRRLALVGCAVCDTMVSELSSDAALRASLTSLDLSHNVHITDPAPLLLFRKLRFLTLVHTGLNKPIPRPRGRYTLFACTPYHRHSRTCTHLLHATSWRPPVEIHYTNYDSDDE